MNAYHDKTSANTPHLIYVNSVAHSYSDSNSREENISQIPYVRLDVYDELLKNFASLAEDYQKKLLPGRYHN